MRGEAPGPVRAQCPRIGEGQVKEVGVGGLVSKGGAMWLLFRGETSKGYNL